MKKVLSISDLDVQPISDEELQAIGAQGGSDNTSVECCDNSGLIIVTGC